MLKWPHLIDFVTQSIELVIAEFGLQSFEEDCIIKPTQ